MLDQVFITTPDGDRLMKIDEVSERVALGKSAIYSKIQEGSFPAAVRLSPGAVRWRKSEIDAWIRDLPSNRAIGAAGP